MDQDQIRTDEQYSKIGQAIIYSLCGRAGFDEAFDVDEIKLEIGALAYKESLDALELDNY
jgi:hypothetical protein